MTINLKAPELRELKPRLMVFGVGGAGSNAVNRMIRAELLGVEFIAVNTDAQALMKSNAPVRIRIGDAISRGLGAGGDSGVGERAGGVGCLEGVLGLPAVLPALFDLLGERGRVPVLGQVVAGLGAGRVVGVHTLPGTSAEAALRLTQS